MGLCTIFISQSKTEVTNNSRERGRLRLNGLPMHREPWKYRNTLNCSKMKGKDRSPNSANQSSFTGSSVYHLAGFHPHWHLNANHYSLLCLVIKGKSTHKHCQRRAANMWGSIIWKYPMAGQGAYDSGILPPLCCVTFSKAP